MLYIIKFICNGKQFYNCTCSKNVRNDQWMFQCQQIENLRCNYLQIKPKRCIQILRENKEITAIFKENKNI